MSKNNIFVIVVVCYFSLLIIADCVSAAEWSLSFIERHDDTAYSGYLDIIIGGTTIDTLTTGTDTKSYGLLNYDISPYVSANGGESIIFRFRSASAGALRTTVMIYNVTVKRNGEWVKFTPWTYSETQSVFRDMSYNERRFMLGLPNKAGYGNGDYSQLESYPLTPTPELVIRQSGLKFNKTIYNINDGDYVQVNVTVENIGSVPDNNAFVRLYVDNALYQTSSGHSINNGSRYNYTFNMQIPALSPGIKITAEVVPSSTEGMTENNNATKYIVKHPYITFTDYTQTPGYVYASNQPYAGWISDLTAAAASAALTDFSNTGTNEFTRCHYAKQMAAYYVTSGDEDYANLTAEALSYLGHGQVITGTPWRWANRSYAGNETSDQDYNMSGSTYLAGDFGSMVECAYAYDWTAEYIETNRADAATIRDNLAHMMLDDYLMIKEIFAYAEGQTVPVSGDQHSVMASVYSAAGTLALAIPDYDGQYQDLDEVGGSPYDIFRYAETGYLDESRMGAIDGYFEGDTLYDGVFAEGNYKSYFGVLPVPWLNAHKSLTGENLLDRYFYLKGYLFEEAYHTTPVKAYEMHIPTSTSNLWCYQYLTPYLFGGEEKYAINWYIQNALETYDDSFNTYASRRKAEGCTINEMIDALMIYNSSETATAYCPNGECSYVGSGKTYNVLRSGYDNTDLYMSFLVTNETTFVGGHAARHGDTMSFDIWAKGAYLIVDSGDPRWLYVGTTGYEQYGSTWGKGPGGHNTVLFDNAGVTRGINRDSQTIYKEEEGNPSYINDSMTSENVDFLHGFMRINEYAGLGSGYGATGTLGNSIDFNRYILFPSDEYYIVADDLTSAAGRNYYMLIQFGSTEIVNNNASTYDDQHVNGNMTIDGAPFNWWDWSKDNNQAHNALSESSFQNVDDIVWSTFTEARNSNEEAGRVKVNVTVHLNPSATLTINWTVGKSGAYGGTRDAFHPYAKVVQNSTNARYMTVYYPNNVMETPATMTTLSVTGGSGNDYATKVLAGSNTDIVTYSDGENIVAGDVATDAVISFSRKSGSTLSYFFVRDGTYFSYAGIGKLDVLSGAPDYVLVSYDGDDVEAKISGSGSATVKILGLKSYNAYSVRRDGVGYSGSNWDIVDGGTAVEITTSLSEHTFEIYVLEEGEAPPEEEPPVEEVPDGGSPSGGSTGGTSGETCTESWTCSDWFSCTTGLKTRSCYDVNSCGTNTTKPTSSAECCEKLNVLLYPLNMRVNNGTKVDFVVSGETNCNPTEVELIIGGLQKDWYTTELLPSEDTGEVRFNVSIRIPSDATGVYNVSFKAKAPLVEGASYTSTLSVVAPRTTERTPALDESILPAPDMWLITEIVMAIVLGILIVVLTRVYVAY